MDFNNTIYITGSAGAVGIATTSPSGKLHVAGGGAYMSNLDGSYRVPVANTELVPKQYVDGVFAPIAGASTLLSGKLFSFDNRVISPSEGATSTAQFGFTSFTNNNSSPWADYLHLRSYADSSGGYDNLLMFSKSAIHGKVWQQSYGSATAYSSYRDMFFGNGTAASATAGYISKFADYDYVNNSAIYDNNGQIGIGTTAPLTTLEVRGANQAIGGNYNTYGNLFISASDALAANIGGSLSLGGIGSTGGAVYTYARIHGKKVTANSTDTAGYLAFETNKQATGYLVEAMRIDTNGNVGIGTSTPAYKLDVNGTGRFVNAVSVGTPVATSDATTKSYVDSAIASVTSTYAGGQYWAGSGNNINNTNSGNVGIGTSSPTAKFQVHGGDMKFSSVSNGYLYFGQDSNGTYMEQVGNNTSNENYRLQSSKSGDVANYSQFVIDPTSGFSFTTLGTGNGNVGIGIAAPSEKLEVSGRSRFNSGASFSAIDTGWVSAHGYSTGNWGVRLGATGGAGVIQVAQTTTAYPLSLQLYGGSVGIGNASPSSTLHVTGGIRATTASQFDSTVVVGTPTAGTHAIPRDWYYSVASGTQNYVAKFTDTHSFGNSQIFDNGTNVGIGTAIPTAKLDVVGNTRLGADGTYKYYPNIAAYRGDGTVAGAIVIHTPIARASNEMFRIRVHGFAYGAGKDIDFVVVGYAYSGCNGNVDGLGGCITSYDIQDAGTDGMNKYVGVDASGKLSIALGDDTSSFYYYRLAVDAWPTRMGTDLNSGWTINNSTVAGFGWLDKKTLAPGRKYASAYYDGDNQSYYLDPSASGLSGSLAGPLSLGTPTAGTHAVTVDYLSSALAGYVTTSTYGVGGGFWALSGSNLYPTSTAYNVAIGTATANQKLEVSGNVRLTNMNNEVQIGGAKSSLSYGWSSYSGSSYPAVQISTSSGRGDTDAERIFIGVARYNGNTSGSFNGNEIISRAYTPWMVPTYANTNYVGVWATDAQDGIQIGRWGGAGYAIESNGGALTIASSSYVGVGTYLTNPAYKLDVQGTGGFTSTVVVGTPTIGTHAVNKDYLDSAYFKNAGNSFNGTAVLGTNDAYPLGLEVGGTTRLTVATSGYVGIGVATPAWPLQVVGAGSGNTVGGIIGSTYQVGGVNNAAFGATSKAGLVGSASYTGTVNLPANPLGTQYAAAGVVGIGGGQSGQAYGIGVAGFGQTIVGATGLTAGGKFLANTNGALANAESLYGVYSSADGTTNTISSADSAYGIYAAGLGAGNDVTYGGYFSGSGGTTNYGVYSAAGTNYFNGNVGIATTTPAFKLAIAGGDIYIQDATQANDKFAATVGYVKASIASATSTAFIQNGNSFGTTATLGTNDTNRLGFEVGGTTYMTVATSGFVGIGTQTPAYRLTVDGGSALAATFTSTNDAQIYLNSSDAWNGISFNDSGAVNDNIFYNGGYGTFAIGGGGANVSGKKLHVDGGMSVGANSDASAVPAEGIYVEGNVGISTTTPSGKLHVAGGGAYMSNLDGSYRVPVANTELVPKQYVDSVFQPIATDALWTLTGSVIYASSTSRQVAIGSASASAWAKLDVRGGQIVAEQSGGTGYDSFDGTGGSDGSRGLRASWTSGYGASLEAWDGGAPKWGIFRWNATTSYPVMQGLYTSNNVYFSGNMGIATTSASNTLDVQGTGGFTGQLYIPVTPLSSSSAASKQYVDTTFAPIGTVGLPAGTTGQTLRHNGSTWVANSVIYNNGSTIGIGTTSGSSMLTVAGSLSAVATTTSVSIYMSGAVGGVATISQNMNGSPNIMGITTSNNGELILNGSGSTGVVAIGTMATTSAKLTIGGSPTIAIDAGGGRIQNLATTPVNGNDAATRTYVDGVASKWNLSSTNIYNNNAGNIGIGSSTAPSYKLHVFGSLGASGSIVANGGITLGAGTNITGVNKITVTTIDPVYRIGGVNYATYAGSFAGGVKEEYSGKAKLKAQMSKNKKIDIGNSDLDITGTGYEYVIDFSSVPVGSDLWVWYKAIDFSRDNIEAVATPYGQSASIYYVIEGKKIIFRGDKGAEFSFRLTGKRHDWREWPTMSKDQEEKPSFILD